MRGLGWLAVVIGILIGVGTFVWVQETRAAYDELCRRGRTYACLYGGRDVVEGARNGYLIAICVLGFGMLILALRRPTGQ